jgi:hypothetical protein
MHQKEKRKKHQKFKDVQMHIQRTNSFCIGFLLLKQKLTFIDHESSLLYQT